MQTGGFSNPGLRVAWLPTLGNTGWHHCQIPKDIA